MLAIINAALRRPVTIFMSFLALILLGFLALGDLPVDLFPPLDFPELTVHTRYSNALPEEVEYNVTRPLEEAIASAGAIREIRSQSFLGESLIRVKFDWGHDMRRAALAVRQQVDRVSDWLPREASRPVVLPDNPQNQPILTLAVSGADERYLAHFSDYVIKRRLEQVNGVAYAAILGAPEREIYVECDPNLLKSAGISAETIQRQLRENNIRFNAGSIRQGHFRLALRVHSEYRTLDDIARLPIPAPGGAPVTLSKLAHIYEGVPERESLTRLNGDNCIALDIHKEGQANTVLIGERIKEVVEQLRREYPQLSFNVISNQAQFIRQAINSVVQAVALGGLLSFLVLFLFLRSLKAPLIIGISIPVSLIAAFLLMQFSGISLNIISLAGLALGSGMLVDNAIIVLENINRHRAMGKTVFEAALQGTHEVALPITASTLTTLAVFVPVIFLEDLSGQLFGQQAATASFALLASLVVSFTLLPVLYHTWHRREKTNIVGFEIIKMKRLYDYYDRFLTVCLRNKKTVLGLTLLTLILSLGLMFRLERRLLPESDQQGLHLDMTFLPGVHMDWISDYVAGWEAWLANSGQTEFYYSRIGKKPGVFFDYDERRINRAQIYTLLNPHVGSADFLHALKRRIPDHVNIRFDFRRQQTALEQLLGRQALRIDLNISGSDLAMLDTLARQMQRHIEALDASSFRGSNYFERYPALQLTPDRDKMMRYAIRPVDIENTLRLAADGLVSSDFRDFDRTYRIILRTPESIRRDINAIRALPVANGDYPLSAFVSIESTEQLAAIERLNQARTFTLYLSPGGSLNRFISQLEQTIKTTPLPAGYSMRIGGAWQETMHSLRLLLLAFLLSVVLVYLLLAAQFESFRIPFVVMFTVPLAFIGIVPLLMISGQSLNIMSAIGVVVVTGIVVNDGIIKIDFIERLRREGRSIDMAIHEAGRARLRPIVMTTVTTLFGLLPLAMGLGAGAGLQQPMAIAIIGGVGVASLLTLFVLPVIYRVLHRKDSANE